jgi:diaminohydroxyphosphoribosylaminopyrimidine deaminase / 5-amino-6-(5-phosphoribosylamino)uracil reductase
MHRCLQLAKLAIGNVAPNPMVGAVLVYEGRIIGEGYHKRYGQPHAEVNCIASVKAEDEHLISQSTLYVSLEPCAHFGKTPPCADLIIHKNIPNVVVGCRDPFVEVNGKGIEKLKAAGVHVALGILENECKEINKRFFTFHTQRRPYVILKWAQTLNGKIAKLGKKRLKISNEFSDRLVHKWRSEEPGIVVGTNTALNDDPQLDTRLWPGKNPVRIVVDMNLRLPQWLKVFDGTTPTIIFNKHQHSLPFEKTAASSLIGVNYYQVTEDVSLVTQMLNGLYQLGIQSILVEGGAQLLQSFIDEGAWDEARVITNEQLVVDNGLPAPHLTAARLVGSESFFSDVIRFFERVQA